MVYSIYKNLCSESAQYQELSYQKVEKVLDTMRDYQFQDGENVTISEINGPIIKLELRGLYGKSLSLPLIEIESSLKKHIPEIQEVIQVIPNGPKLDSEEVDIVLDGVRVLLDTAGGTIDCVDISDVDRLQPCITLRILGKVVFLKGLEERIVERLQKHFMLPALRVQYENGDY